MTTSSRLRAGFTLIELLVVIAIIGVLTAAGLVFFGNAQKSARDTKRTADIRAIGQAMEQYKSSNGTYPTTGASAIDSATYFPSGARPTDPVGAAAYGNSVPAAGTGYCFCATLENLGRGNAVAPGVAAANNGTCSFGTPAAGAQGYYCVQNQQ